MAEYPAAFSVKRQREHFHFSPEHSQMVLGFLLISSSLELIRTEGQSWVNRGHFSFQKLSTCLVGRVQVENI